MGKIICDVCGTAYPDTAAQCPICGYAKNADAAVDGSAAGATAGAASGYTYVKGGRFSKANVRKRNKANQNQMPRVRADDRDEAPEEPTGRSNKGLVIAVLVLLLAIVAVVVYIAVRFFLPAYNGFGWFGSDETTASTTVETTTEETTIDDGMIHCTKLNVTDTAITFDAPGQAWKLNVQAEPADTTDVITYSSSDEAVATVSEEGIVTAIGAGDAVITITCGDVIVSCEVSCTIAETEETTVPETTVPETTVPETTEPRVYSMRINGSTRKSYDVTINVGGTFTLTMTDQDGNIVDVDWENSGPSYVSINGNTVKGKAKTSYVKISTELDGTTYTCIVRVTG